MSDVINGVPRELLAKIADYAPGHPWFDELAVLLTAQPQASAAQSAPAGEQPAPYGWVAAGQFFAAREDAVDAAGKAPCVEVYSRPQVLAILSRSAERQALAEELARLLNQSGDEFRALKSAPAGEREAFEEWAAGEGYNLTPGMSGYLIRETKEAYRGFRAAWQRTQSAGVPEGWKLVPKSPTSTMLLAAFDKTGESNSMRSRVNTRMLGVYHAMLAAAPAQPAAQGDVVVTRNTAGQIVAVTRQDEEGRILSVIAEAEPAAHDQGEVQRLREALEAIAADDYEAPHDADDAYISRRKGACIARMRGTARAALAASTGQEVKP